MRNTVLAIAGRARSGKDTLTSIFFKHPTVRELLTYAPYSYSFATPLKSMLSEGLNIDMSPHIDKEEIIPLLGVSRRELLQTLGTDWGRNMIDKDMWVKLATLRLIQRGPGMLISDTRFENEAQWVRDMGGTVIHITRKDAPKVREHVSESTLEIKENDIVITNDGTIEELEKQLYDSLSTYHEHKT